MSKIAFAKEYFVVHEYEAVSKTEAFANLEKK
jgi:hypothetical protein